MADKKIDLNILGQVIDTSWTRSSASAGPTLETYSVKTSFESGGGDTVRLKVMYTTTANMVRDRQLRDSKELCEREGDSYIDSAVKQIIKGYSELSNEPTTDVDDTGFDVPVEAKSSIKLKRVSVRTNVEVIDLNVFNNKRSALFRRIAIFEVS